MNKFKNFENKSLDLVPLTQLMFITPFDYNEDIIKQIDFINYKDKNKLSNICKK